MLTPKEFPPAPEDERLAWCQFGLPGGTTVEFRNEIAKVLRAHAREFGNCRLDVGAGYKTILVTLYPRHTVTPEIVSKLNTILAPYAGAADKIELYLDDDRL